MSSLRVVSITSVSSVQNAREYALNVWECVCMRWMRVWDEDLDLVWIRLHSFAFVCIRWHSLSRTMRATMHTVFVRIRRTFMSQYIVFWKNSILLYMTCITLHSDTFVMFECIHLYLIREWCPRPCRHSHGCIQCAFTYLDLSVFGFGCIHDVFGLAWSRILSNTFEAEYTRAN